MIAYTCFLYYSMKASHLLVGNIKVLLLANNCIIDVQGLDHLYSLQKLDLQNNRISKLCDVSALARLPELMELNLKGNPFASKGKTPLDLYFRRKYS